MASGKSPWLPVPLDYLFPQAPPDSASTDYKLSVDPTWGGKEKGGSPEPEDASFGFFVLSSPEALQVSLDKRDGSDWEVFDCHDAVSENTQTVRVMCTSDNEDSNCGKIFLGHGVPGTILEMPAGCGPGKYAVAVDMKISKDQSLPPHLAKRDFGFVPTVHDLTFDYDFRRVPRDLGDTQFRLDFSNQEGYWDGVVDKAASKKRKRSLEDYGGSHHRWLEDAWREDYHHSKLPRSELHERWFGQDIVAWLKQLLNVAQGAPLLEHYVDETVTVVFYDQHMGPCTVGGVNLEANLNIRAETNIHIEASFGVTLIGKLGVPISLTDSQIYFRTKGGVTAKFIMDALATAHFSTGDIELFGLENFGATFRVPGFITVGPNLQLFGSLDGQVTIAGRVEAQVKIAGWNIQQTYPAVNSDYAPKALSNPRYDDTMPVGQPTLNYSVSADGSLTAHLKPVVTFGIDFDSQWSITSCKIDLTLDGWTLLHATAETSNSGGSSFCYGVDAGAEVYASVTAPSVFGWDLSVPKYQFAQTPVKQIVPETCPLKTRDLQDDHGTWGSVGGTHMDVGGAVDVKDVHSAEDFGSSPFSFGLGKRGRIIGPLIDAASCLFCPTNDQDQNPSECGACESSEEERDAFCSQIGPAPGERACDAANLVEPPPSLEKRDTKKILIFGDIYADVGTYTSCDTSLSKYWTFTSMTDCTDFSLSKLNKNQVTGNFVTEHVYEAQLLGAFLNFITTLSGPGGHSPDQSWSPVTQKWVKDYILGYEQQQPYEVHGNTLWEMISNEVGHNLNADGKGRLALAHAHINGPKTIWYQLRSPNINTMGETMAQLKWSVKSAVSPFYYMAQPTIWAKMVQTSLGIEQDLIAFDDQFDNDRTIPAADKKNFHLRDAYCFFINKLHSEIESNAKAWSKAAAKALTEQTQYSTLPAWVKANMEGNGQAA